MNGDTLEELSGKEKIEFKKKLNKDIYEITKDLIDDTLNCNIKYHEWINENKTNIMPIKNKDSYLVDLSNDPQKYLKHMIWMNIELGKLGSKKFNVLPLRSNLIPRYIRLDTKGLIDLFETDKNSSLKNITSCKNDIWKKYFYINKKIFKRSNCAFDYSILTDGFAVSIQFIKNEFVDEQNKKKLIKQNGLKEYKKNKKEMSEEEFSKLKIEKQERIKKEKEKKKEKIRQKKEEFKKLSKEEKEKIKLDMKKKEHIEFPYMDELSTNQLDKLKETKKIYVDPGKRAYSTW